MSAIDLNLIDVSIGLFNPKSPENVNSVMRAAGNYGVDEVFYTGSRYQRALKLNTSMPNVRRSISHNIPLKSVNCLVASVAKNTRIVCIEFAENATPLPQYLHADKACYIFGPEDGSLSQAIIDKADDVVYIPTTGCMNLAATVNVLLYDRLLKLSSQEAGNQLIRQSRDTNNNLKVRIK